MNAATLVESVPFMDLGRHLGPLRAEIVASFEGTLDRHDFIGGQDVREFEREMSEWLGVDGVCAVANATLGLWALLHALGVRPGDEVATTVHTAMPTAEAITLAGAKVVFCDIDPATYNIDPEDLARRVTDRTRAIIPVHLYGQPADLDAVLSIARERSIPVIEDCAQAQGAKYRDAYVGTHADAAAFSFFPSKTLGGIGDGGAITARDPEVFKRARMFSNHGRIEKYVHEFEGINSRLDTIKAGMLRIGLRHLDEWNELRRRAASKYDALLQGTPDLVLPTVGPDRTHVYMNYIVRTPDRDALAAHLREHGVRTGLHYPSSLNQQPAYAYLGQGDGSFPNAERACREVLSLPMFPGIETPEIETVCHWIREKLG